MAAPPDGRGLQPGTGHPGAGRSRDGRLLTHHILASLAHARMLKQQKLLSASEARSLTLGLVELLAHPPDPGESPRTGDLQGAVGMALSQRLGVSLARKLDLGRDSVDQAATDLRLWAREAILDELEATVALRQALVSAAEQQGEQVMPAYQGLRRTGPILLAHHLIAYVEMFYRDGNRLREAYVRADILPLGAGDGSGAPFPVDRALVAELLGMHTTTRNSLDAVGDRDFVVEHLTVLAILALHLSRLAEELLLWSSAEFGFLLSEDAEGQLPQTIHAVASDARAATGQVYGSLMAVLTTMKALPLGYSHDLDRLIPPYFGAADLVQETMRACTELVESAPWQPKRLDQAARQSLRPHGDLSAYLAARDPRGGTAPVEVFAAIRESQPRIDALRAWIAEQRARLPTVQRLLAQ